MSANQSRNAHLHRRRSSVNFGGRAGSSTFLPENYVWKSNKMPEFYVIFAPKNIKIPEFSWYLPEKLTKFPNYARYLPENSRIFIWQLPEKYFPDFLVGTCSPAPVSYAGYAHLHTYYPTTRQAINHPVVRWRIAWQRVQWTNDWSNSWIGICVPPVVITWLCRDSLSTYAYGRAFAAAGPAAWNSLSNDATRRLALTVSDAYSKLVCFQRTD